MPDFHNGSIPCSPLKTSTALKLSPKHRDANTSNTSQSVGAHKRLSNMCLYLSKHSSFQRLVSRQTIVPSSSKGVNPTGQSNHALEARISVFPATMSLLGCSIIGETGNFYQPMGGLCCSFSRTALNRLEACNSSVQMACTQKLLSESSSICFVDQLFRWMRKDTLEKCCDSFSKIYGHVLS